MAPRDEFAFTLVCRTLARISDRYEELRCQRGWRSEPACEEILLGYSGLLTRALSPAELGSVQGLLRDVERKHAAMLRRQRESGFCPRGLDLAYVAVCHEALSRVSPKEKDGKVLGRTRAAGRRTEWAR